MVEHAFHGCQVDYGRAVKIRPFTEDDLEAELSLLLAADDSRVLSLESLRHWRLSQPAEARYVNLVAEEGGRVVGAGGGGLNIWTSTPNAGGAFVTVADDRRREGIGDALWQAVLEHLRAIGVARATTFMRHTEEGERFAAARGFERVIAGPLIALDPRHVPAPELPPGLRCLPLSELTPEDVHAALCEAALDEPTAEPNDAISLDEFRREWYDPVFDTRSGTAVLDGTQVVAFAFMKVAGTRAQHGFTGCVRSHRGRGLATAAKRAALRTAAANGVTRVVTSNAVENTAMRAINRRLGFEPVGEHLILACVL